MTATSVASSLPSTVAVRVVPSSNLTVIEVAPSTTWAAVTMWPCLVDDEARAGGGDWEAAARRRTATRKRPTRALTVMSTTPGDAAA